MGLLPQARRAYHRLRSNYASWIGTHAGNDGALRGGSRNHSTYLARIRQEQSTYADVANVHDLPEIFHYWSNKYLLPKCEAFGFSHPDEFFANHLQRAMPSSGCARFVSVGAGNCDTEVRVAALLKARGCGQFRIECLDINASMLARGEQLADERGVGEYVVPRVADFNRWSPDSNYHAVMANQSLHHVVALEDLLGAIEDALEPEGLFVVSDMIGRNGHMRWPEALRWVREFWKELPPAYRRNLQLGRDEPEFLDWDCAVSGFEGIRAQDILPLLVERFHFHQFLPFANVIDPFIDRSFGHHFKADQSWDRDFIDRVHALDEAEILAGRIKPTHMFAVLGKSDREPIHWSGLTPEQCIRRPD